MMLVGLLDNVKGVGGVWIIIVGIIRIFGLLG